MEERKSKCGAYVIEEEIGSWAAIVDDEMHHRAINDTLETTGYRFMNNIVDVAERKPYFDCGDDSKYAFSILTVRYKGQREEIEHRSDDDHFLYSLIDVKNQDVTFISPEWHRHAMPIEIYSVLDEEEVARYVDAKRVLWKLFSKSYSSIEERFVPTPFKGFREINEFINERDMFTFTNGLPYECMTVDTLGQFILTCFLLRFFRSQSGGGATADELMDIEKLSSDVSLRVLLMFISALHRMRDNGTRSATLLVQLYDWIVLGTCDDCVLKSLLHHYGNKYMGNYLFPFSWNRSDSVSKFLSIIDVPNIFLGVKDECTEVMNPLCDDSWTRIVIKRFLKHSFVFQENGQATTRIRVHIETGTAINDEVLTARHWKVILFCIDAHVKAYKFMYRLGSDAGLMVFLRDSGIDLTQERNDLVSIIIPELEFLSDERRPLGLFIQSFMFLLTTGRIFTDLYDHFVSSFLECGNMVRATIEAHMKYKAPDFIDRFMRMLMAKEFDEIFRPPTDALWPHWVYKDIQFHWKLGRPYGQEYNINLWLASLTAQERNVLIPGKEIRSVFVGEEPTDRPNYISRDDSHFMDWKHTNWRQAVSDYRYGELCSIGCNHVPHCVPIAMCPNRRWILPQPSSSKPRLRKEIKVEIEREEGSQSTSSDVFEEPRSTSNRRYKSVRSSKFKGGTLSVYKRRY